MKKDTFLTIIQQSACVPGTNANRIWEHAISKEENDLRWNAIYAESYGVDEVLRQYCKYFGDVTYQEAAPKRVRRTQVERFTIQLEKALKERESVPMERQAAYQTRIDRLGKQLARAKKHNL